MRDRLKGVFTLALIFETILISRAFYIQIIKDKRLERMAQRQFQTKFQVHARRGLILDRNKEPLSINKEAFSLAANPNKIQSRKTLARLLAKSLGISDQKIIQQFGSKKSFIWIKRRLPENHLALFKKWGVLTSKDEMPEGLWLVREDDRTYPHRDLLAAVLGSVNLDQRGVEGIELWQDARLAGTDAKFKSIRDALGRPTHLDPSVADTLKDGEDVTLTIDTSLQFGIEEALGRSLESTGARNGLVIVMDAMKGDLLAVAHAPSFNPNYRFAPQELRKNRFITDLYEPGSTIKPILVAGSLLKGFKLSDRFHGDFGNIKIQGRTISEAEAHEKFEWISLEKNIAVSSNVVSAKLALKLGAKNVFNTLQMFGFNEKTGSNIPGENKGVVGDYKKWKALTLANIGFGQGILTTPLQILRAYAAFANGGYLITPRILLDSYGAPIFKRVLPEAVALEMTQALTKVTAADGTGAKAKLSGFEVAGKTGTAQTVDPNTKRYSSSRYISTFVGYPVGVLPKVVILTYLDGPKRSYYASDTAAPLFRAALEAFVHRYGIPATHPEETAPLLTQNSINKLLKAQKVEISEDEPENPNNSETPLNAGFFRMPNLKGKPLRSALDVLRQTNTKLDWNGSGFVESQNPDPGTILKEGETVKLILHEPVEYQ